MCEGGGDESAKLPSVSALIAEDEGRHRFVCGPGLQLVVGAVSLAALAALHQGRLCTLQKS